MKFTESSVEAAALEWFAELGYPVAHGADIAPGEPQAERSSFHDVVLVGCLGIPHPAVRIPLSPLGCPPRTELTKEWGQGNYALRSGGELLPCAHGVTIW